MRLSKVPTAELVEVLAVNEKMAPESCATRLIRDELERRRDAERKRQEQACVRPARARR